MNPLKAYAAEHTALAIQSLDLFLQSGKEEAMHELRVSLKKGRALLDFLEKQKKHEKKISKLKKQVREVFKQAGLIRLNHLRIKWMKSNRYRLLLQNASLETDLNGYTSDFLSEARRNKNVLTALHKTVAKESEHTSLVQVLSYAKKLKAKVIRLASGLQQSHWHHLRKNIKRLMYAYHWLMEKDKIKLLTLRQYNYLDQLQSSIGLWHDAEDMKTWISEAQFFFHPNEKVKQQFNRCWVKLTNEISEQEKAVADLLKRKNSLLKISKLQIQGRK